MLVPASRSLPRARTVHARHVIISSCLTCQRRAMGFGSWGSSQAEPGSDLDRDARTRHRSHRYRYMESINRSLSWHHKSHHADTKEVMKKAMAYFIQQPAAAADRAKYVHPDSDIKSWSDDVSGLRPGRNIEDVEREAISHLLRPGHDRKMPYDIWKTPLRNIRLRLQAQRAPTPVTPSEVLQATSTAATTTSHHTAAESSADAEESIIDPIPNRRVAKGSVSKSTLSKEAPGKEAPGKEAPDHVSASQLDAADQSSPHPPKAAEDAAELEKYRSTKWHGAYDAHEVKAAEETRDTSDELPSHGAARWNSRHGVRDLTADERSKEQEELRQYDAVYSNDADALNGPAQAQPSERDKELDKYGPVLWNEPNGSREPTPEELSKYYEDLGEYNPVMWNEPDGQRALTAEEQLQSYQDLDSYDGPRTAEKSVIESYEAAQLDTTPKGNVLPPKVEVASEAPGKEYTDLDKYGPVYWNEPHGSRGPSPEERSRQYDDLHLYRGPFYNDTASIKQDTPDKLSESELAKYRYLGSGPAIRAEQAQAHEPTSQYQDLDKYRPREFDSPVSSHGESTADIGFAQVGKVSNVSGAGSIKSGTSGSGAGDESGNGDNFDSMTPDEIRAGVVRRAKLDSQETYPAKSDSEGHASSDKSKLVGNFARDFPEEFSTSWSTSHSPSKSTLYPKDKAEQPGQMESMMREDPDASSMDESFPTESSKLEPALNRYARRRNPKMDDPGRLTASTDQTSKDQTNPPEALGDVSAWPVAKHYGATQTPSSGAVTMGSGATPEGSSLYKILAYDSATDTVRIAETSSSAVADPSSPVSPADVIPRLANPAKFFPHFAALQKEGYEIVSGHGDVLVFRQARSAPTQSPAAPASPPINPVDMMGKPVTGNFASPTGFVNYDTIAEEKTEKPEPPFRSGIYVRKEEPVFSGAKESGVQSRKKRGLGRKMALGTAYVAGGAYAVGVIGEYFGNAGGTPGARRF